MTEISAAGDAYGSSSSTDEEIPRNSTIKWRKPPLISLVMLSRATGNQIASLSINEVTRRVYEGVLLKDNKEQGKAKNGAEQELPYTHKYWVDKELNRNCLMVLARGLQILWSDCSENWKWIEEKEPCYLGKKKVDIAELQKIRRLEISGKCKTIMLSPRTTYEVEILVKMRRDATALTGMKLSLDLPDGNKMESEKKLDNSKWCPISIGKFETTPKTVGEIRFSLMQTDGDLKSGLCVKGVVFRPIGV